MTSDRHDADWATGAPPTVPGGWAPRGGAVLASGLRHSRMFAIAVGVYQHHRLGADQRCQRCDGFLCRPRGHAAKIILAAGVDPHDFDVHAPVADAQVKINAMSRSSTRAPASGGCAGRRRPATTIPRWSWPDEATPAFYRHRAPLGTWNGAVMPTVGATGRSADSYPLRGLLFCDVCDVPLYPLKLAGGPRAYRGACGCRLRPVDAATVERQVFNAVERHAPALLGGVPAACLAGVYRSVLAQVRAGVTGDELTFAWRV